MEKLEYGQRVRLDHTETTVDAVWAQGRHCTIVLTDGRRFSDRDIDSLMQSGRLVLLDSSVENTKDINETDDDDWGSPYGEYRED